MEQKSIPEWVKIKEASIYREYMLMTKEEILKRQWEIQSKYKKNEMEAIFWLIIFGLLTITFELLWIKASGGF